VTVALLDGHEVERAAVILARYRAIRPRLPAASFPVAPHHAPDLGALADRFDAFLFDAFGVLNVGTSACQQQRAKSGPSRGFNARRRPPCTMGL